MFSRTRVLNDASNSFIGSGLRPCASAAATSVATGAASAPTLDGALRHYLGRFLPLLLGWRSGSEMVPVRDS